MITKKIKQTIACALVLGVLAGTTPSKVFADTLEDDMVQLVSTASTNSHKEGLYEAVNITRYIEEGNSTGESSARSSIETTTKIEVKDGKYINTLYLNKNTFQFMKDLKISVDGNVIESVVNETEKSITFTLDSISTEVRVDMNITMMGRDVSFFVKSDEATFTLVNEAPVITGANATVKVGDSVGLIDLVSVSDNDGDAVDLRILTDISSFIKDGVAYKAGTYDIVFQAIDANGLISQKTITLTIEDIKSEGLKDGSYKIKNQVEYVGTGNSQIGNDMARKTLEETSYLQVKESKNLLTLKFNEDQLAFIGDINVSVDGVEVETKVDRDAAEAVLEIPSLNSDIEVTVEVTMMGRETTFKTILLENTLEKIEEVENSGSSNGSTGGTTGGTIEGSGNGSQGESTDGSDSNIGTTPEMDNTDKKEIKIVKGKLYSIENDVHYADNNPTGLAMARQYLEKISKIEEVEGVKYITLTFNGVEYMSNHRFYIDGKEVSFRTVSNDGKQASFRFVLPDLGSTIKVKMYVAPMGRDVEFDVTLNQGTLTFIKEYDVEVLPQTGSPMDNNMMFMVGSALAELSVLLKKRKR